MIILYCLYTFIINIHYETIDSMLFRKVMLLVDRLPPLLTGKVDVRVSQLRDVCRRHWGNILVYNVLEICFCFCLWEFPPVTCTLSKCVNSGTVVKQDTFLALITQSELDAGCKMCDYDVKPTTSTSVTPILKE